MNRITYKVLSLLVLLSAALLVAVPAFAASGTALEGSFKTMPAIILGSCILLFLAVGFMNKADAMAVAKDMHMADGFFWPTPVLNMVEDASAIKGAKRIALLDPNVEGNPVIAIQDVEAIEEYTDDEMKEMTESIFRTQDMDHPGVNAFNTVGKTGIAGPIQVLNYFQIPNKLLLLYPYLVFGTILFCLYPG
jgi:hypothetical protein